VRGLIKKFFRGPSTLSTALYGLSTLEDFPKSSKNSGFTLKAHLRPWICITKDTNGIQCSGLLWRNLSIFTFFSFHSRFILASFVCLLTGAAVGRELACFEFTAKSSTLWPAHEQVYIRNLDLSAKFETEEHSFKLTPGKKLEIKTFQIHESPQLDFIPLGILGEFPNLDGLIILHCNLPTVKSGLFKADFEKIEYLSLQGNKIERIEADAFQYLIKLKWLDLYKNSLKTLSHQIFKNNPDLTYIDLNYLQPDPHCPPELFRWLGEIEADRLQIWKLLSSLDDRMRNLLD
jgi:hypothetical protein